MSRGLIEAQCQADDQHRHGLMERSLGQEHPSYGAALATYARMLRKVGRDREAKPVLARAKAIHEEAQRQHPGRVTVEASDFR